MKIALIGASGQLGTDIQKVIPKDNLVNLDRPDFDITVPATLSQLFDIKPDIIINTAAYNLVDKAEESPEQALAVNYHGVENLIEICLKLDIPLVHFSTDYIFGKDKNRNTPYVETDIPGPVNKYGESKLKGEQIIQQKMKKYFIIRTAYLFGTAGSLGKGTNIVEALIKKAKEQENLKVVNDQITTPTYTLDLARQVWKLVQTDNYGLYHATAEGKCSIYEFACKIFEYLNLNPKITPVTTEEYNLSADRPRYSVLENKKLKDLGLNIMRPWQEPLEDYLKEKKYIK